ncbi:MAG: iron ABC transporter permease [Spirochaetes bacterium]|nr:iron ABC transporter permease [Spirochaetota bacterium]
MSLSETAKRRIYLIKQYSFSSYQLIGIIILALLMFLLFTPAAEIIRISFSNKDAFTTHYWSRVLTSRLSRFIFYRPLINTLKLSIGMTVFSVLIGSLLAWLVIRTDLPGRKIIEKVSIISYIIPSWVIGIAWITVFHNSSFFGGFPGLLESFFRVKVPSQISYGLFPIIVVLTLHYFPYTFLLTASSLRSIDSHLEETGEILGASRIRILRKITFPIILPALLSSVILTFSKGLGTFGVPAFLGPPVRFNVLPTVIFSMINTGSLGEAYTLAIITTIIGILTIYMNMKLISARQSFATMSGKGMRMKLFHLGNWKWPLFTVVCVWIAIATLIPLLVLLLQSLMFFPGNFSLSNFTLHFWIGKEMPQLGDAGEPGVLFNSGIIRAIFNSLHLSVLSGLVAALIGFLIGYVVVKGKGTLLSKLLEQFSFLPYLMPGLPFAATYLVLFAHRIGPIPALYGTMTLLVLISVVKRLPFASRTGINSMMQIGKELEESAVVLGANLWRRFRKIVFPLAKNGFIAGFLLTFITVMRELDLIILLVTPKTQVLPTIIYRYAEESVAQFTNALALVIVILTLVVYFIVQKFQNIGILGE